MRKGKLKDFSHITEKNYIYALKAFAIVSIVSAHCQRVAQNTNQLNTIFAWILDQVGSIGVGVFFIVSGYLFYNNRYLFKDFFKKKMRTIFLPWLFTGTGVYFYIVLRRGGIGLRSWIDYLSGNTSILYYLTLLIIFYLLFFYTSKNKKLIFSTIILSSISIMLTAMGVLKGINPYLNPLNFICYFSVGLIISSNNGLLKTAQKCAHYKLLLLALYVALLFLIKTFGISSGYWGYTTLILQPVAISLIFGLATMRFIYNERIIKLGVESFAVYLTHVPAAGLINNVFCSYDLWVFTLAKPVIVVGITLVFIYIYKSVGSKLKIDTYTNPLIGIR